MTTVQIPFGTKEQPPTSETMRVCSKMFTTGVHKTVALSRLYRPIALAGAFRLVSAAWLCLAGVGSSSTYAADWEVHPGYRVRALEVPAKGRAGFTEVDPNLSGILFTNRLPEHILDKDSSLLGGSGVALGDLDGDGLCDIYFCSLSGRNALYHNLGNWHFEEIAESAGVVCPGQVSRGAVFADVNGDRAADLLVNAAGGGTRCFLNDGKGHFRETTAEAGLATNSGSTSLALADVDGDGSLDLYVANFGSGPMLPKGAPVSTRIINGKLTVVGRMAKRVKIIDGQLVQTGEPDVLYLNDGNGRFKPVPWDKGAFLDEEAKIAETPFDFGLSVQMRDLNGDGWPDIYVCNDFYTPDRIWMNDGRGHFRAIAQSGIRKLSYAAMGVDFADIDRDGYMDGLVVEMLARDQTMRVRHVTSDQPGPPVIGGLDRRPQTGRNTFFWNRGDGTFAELAEYAGLSASDWSWMPLFLDVDLDGYEDVLITNGQVYDQQDMDAIDQTKVRDPRVVSTNPIKFPRIETPNAAFRNRGDRTFTECGGLWGFDSKRACNGMAVADLDNDGDLDVVINCLDAGALIYRNESAVPRVAVRLKGLPPNTQGIGALIVVRGGAVPFQSQEIIAGGRFLSGDDPMRVFAAGAATNQLTIEVKWRSGKRSLVTGALPNHLYEIDEAGASAPRQPEPSQVQPLFEDVSDRLGHAHHEAPFDDLELQPLLPKRLSQLGPGVAWCDLGGGAGEQLVIGSGRHGALGVYHWDGKGRFTSASSDPGLVVSGDTTGMAACPLSGRPTLLVGLSNYELPVAHSSAILQVTAANSTSPALGLVSTNLGAGSIGPLAVADIDGDGELEVFAGGRVLPGRYPEAAPSFILRNRNGTLVVDTNLSSALSRVGLVSGAVFSDLSGEGSLQLILACEWGPIRVFRYVHGALREDTEKLGLGKYVGWWQSVTVGDLDGDGRMDIIAGNWGLNSRYHCTDQRPLTLFYGDFDGDGSVQIFETAYDSGSGRLLSLRDWRTMANSMRFLTDRVGNCRGFSRAVQEILGDRMDRAQQLRASNLGSMVFFNRGDHLEAVPMPAEAQWAPVFGVSVADFDGDGQEDVFLAQNFFGLPSEGWRQDAGRGLLLKGDGKGGLKPIPGQESGIRVYGEQRGCAVGDYDGDGRVDLVVTQNGESTRLLHNLGAKPGLRVRLRGPAANPTGVGAVLRVRHAARLGPAREIHAGSGYWSQDSAVQVVAAQAGDQLWVRWPGGKTVSLDVPPRAREVEVNDEGLSKVLQ